MSDDYKDQIAAYIERKTTHIREAVEEIVDDNDDKFEVLDVTNRNKIRRMFRDLTKASVAKQITVGGVSGWCSGYLCGKVGRAAAMALGGSLLVLQVAHHQGYVSVNWGKLEKDIKAAQRRIERKANRKALPAVVDEVQDFVVENAFLAGGFCAGFLIGLVS